MKLKTKCFTLFTLLCCVSAAVAQKNTIALTIYNNDLALVRDVRTLDIAKGRSEVKFLDVAARIDPTSVYFSSLTAADKVTILEQNFEYDLVNSTKILQKYVDQQVNLDAGDGVNYQGVLLSSSGTDVVLRDSTGGIKIINRKSIKNMSFPRLPAGLITRPTLIWKLDCRKAGEHQTEIGYLTNGIQWHAEYVGVTNEDDTGLDLSGWVSIDNKSGATYENAKLKLVAGDVHRAQDVRPLQYLRKQERLALSVAPNGFQEKSFFEYHLYTLQRAATVANNQIKQLSLFEPAAVKSVKKYIYDGARQPKKVKVELEFENSRKAGLGIPLPKGKIRVYKRDSDKSLVLVGEDFVQHTPKDEKVRLYVGDAFDIVGERIQTERRAIGKHSRQENWNIKIRNHKEKRIEVIVIERFAINWEILRKSHNYKKKDAHTVEFLLAVPANGSVLLDYLVRYNN